MTDNKKDNLATALAKFRAALKQPKKDATNPFFKSKYATLDTVVDAIDKAANLAGLTYVQMTDIKDGHFGLVTTIMSTSGESVSGFYVLPATGKPQDIGSSVSYARRYALSAAFGVVADEDDDGNTAAPVIKQPTAPTATFETDKQYLLACQDAASLETYYNGVKARKATFHAHEYAELVTITANKNKQFKGEL